MPALASTILATLLLATACTRPEGHSPGPAAWQGRLQQAAAHLEAGRLDEASAEYRAALDLLRGADAAPLDRVTAMEGLSRALILQGDLAAAESLYTTALETLTDTVGLAHVPGTRLISVLGTLADLNQSLGRTGRAEAYYLRIAGVAEAGWVDLQPTDLALAYTLAGLARVRRARGDTSGADSLAGRAMGINLLSQGYDLFIAERLDEAEPLLRRALALQERFVGLRHPDAARSTHLLGRVTELTGRAAEAADLYHRAAEIYRYGEGRLAVEEAAVLADLADLQRERGQVAAADSAAARALHLRLGTRLGE